MAARTHQINLKLSPSESQKLQRIAQRLALTEQAVLRLLLKQADQEMKIR